MGVQGQQSLCWLQDCTWAHLRFSWMMLNGRNTSLRSVSKGIKGLPLREEPRPTIVPWCVGSHHNMTEVTSACPSYPDVQNGPLKFNRRRLVTLGSNRAPAPVIRFTLLFHYKHLCLTPQGGPSQGARDESSLCYGLVKRTGRSLAVITTVLSLSKGE